MRLVALVAAFAMAIQGVDVQQLDVDRELAEAKALYREARFTQAVVKLQRTIVYLEYLRDIQERKAQLADAHLHLALALVALSDPLAAKESLKAMLRLDRDRRLDPEVHAPKVIELFEAARAELALEPAVGAPSPVPRVGAPAAGAKVPKKGGSKSVPIVLGVGAVAAAGVVVASSGGGKGAPSSPPPSPPAPSDGLPAGEGITVSFVGSTPAPGSTISLGPLTGTRTAVQLTLKFSMTSASARSATLRSILFKDTHACLVANDVGFRVEPGQAASVTVTPYFHLSDDPSCAPPLTTNRVVFQVLEAGFANAFENVLYNFAR